MLAVEGAVLLNRVVGKMHVVVGEVVVREVLAAHAQVALSKVKD